jgi:predicted lipid carrier protein YhbT
MPAARQKMASEADPIARFFSELERQGPIPTFEGQSATVRFEVVDQAGNDRWHVAINRGDVAVSRQKAAAEAVATMRRPDLEALVAGRMNAQAAFLRGAVTCTGSMGALIMFQRCLPGPPGAAGHVAPISSAAVTQEKRGQ